MSEESSRKSKSSTDHAGGGNSGIYWPEHSRSEAVYHI